MDRQLINLVRINKLAAPAEYADNRVALLCEAQVIDPSPTRLRIVLADDDEQVRERLHLLLRELHDVVGAFANGQALLDAADQLHPNLILLDISMPDMSGFAVAGLLRKSMPQVPVIFVTQHGEAVYVAEAFRIGVAGYVLKRHIVNELQVAVRDVNQGRQYFSPALQFRPPPAA